MQRTPAAPRKLRDIWKSKQFPRESDAYHATAVEREKERRNSVMWHVCVRVARRGIDTSFQHFGVCTRNFFFFFTCVSYVCLEKSAVIWRSVVFRVLVVKNFVVPLGGIDVTRVYRVRLLEEFHSLWKIYWKRKVYRLNLLFRRAHVYTAKLYKQNRCIGIL